MYYPITLDRERNFRLNMKAICAAEKKLKRSIASIGNDFSMEATATLLWAGLVHEDDKLTVDAVFDLIDEYSCVGDIIKVVAEGLSYTFEGKKEVVKEDKSEKNAKRAAKNLA